MTANYPLRWDPVPAGCHGDIARASANTGAAARSHPDPELTGKVCRGRRRFGRAPLITPAHPREFVINKTASLDHSEAPHPHPTPGTFLLFLSEHGPLVRDKMEIVESRDVYSLTCPCQDQLHMKDTNIIYRIKPSQRYVWYLVFNGFCKMPHFMR